MERVHDVVASTASSLDSTVIDLCMSLFDWAKFKRTKGAIKLHLLLDHDGYLPSMAVITDGRTSDIPVARGLRFEPGTVLVLDRGYVDYSWFDQLTRQGVFFVTRLKHSAVYELVEARPIPAKGRFLSDDHIEAVVRQSSTAAAAQFSTERGTFPLLVYDV